ncbi:uncharacterized protein [Ambystoma mexicanum]|uniref:uncharacterized protein n=1 Tax=Ambystoma mexicanum TaxID=8296 RepID=UPI0037E7D33A
MDRGAHAYKSESSALCNIWEEHEDIKDAGGGGSKPCVSNEKVIEIIVGYEVPEIKMLYFMYFFALCGLLAPSQGSDNSDNPMAVVNVCCGEITKILADALGGKLERLLKPAENEGGSGALLPLGNLLGTATNLLQLKNSKLVQVRASCTPKAIRLALQLCIDLTFLSELLAKLPLITDANEITVEATVNVNIPLLLDEKKGLRLEFFQETCNALKISLQVKGLDNLGALSQLTKALKDPLAKLITPGLCKGLSGAVGVLNKKLKTVGGILPTDAAKATNDYIMKSIRKGRNGCLIIDLNVRLIKGLLSVVKLVPLTSRQYTFPQITDEDYLHADAVTQSVKLPPSESQIDASVSPKGSAKGMQFGFMLSPLLCPGVKHWM